MDGSSWNNAASGNMLQTLINASSPGTEVWVACGVYVPTTTNDRTQSFSLRNGVRVYGGFTGSETTLEQRELNCMSCSTLSGEIGAAGISDNSYKIVYNELVDSTAILDGFIIRDANDDRTPTSFGDGLGGGVYNHGYGSSGFCHPTIRNCLFTNNTASWGGGAFNNGYNGGNAEPSYYNCVFYRNHGLIEAGGMDSYGVNGNASPLLVNCIFSENTSATNVGAMYAWGGNANGNCHPVLIHCAFINNTATNGYGGAFIADNLDENGVTSSGSCTVTLENCVVYNNSATGVGPQFYVRGNGAQVIATYSNISLTGQTAPHIISGSGTGNIDSDPLFVAGNNPPGADACWLTADDGLRLQNNSPMINAGSTIANYQYDIMGILYNNNPEIGTYEYLSVAATNEYTQPIGVAYPNPASDEVSVIFADGIQHTIRIVDHMGRLLYENSFLDAAHIDTRNWSVGTYLIHIDHVRFETLVIQ